MKRIIAIIMITAACAMPLAACHDGTEPEEKTTAIAAENEGKLQLPYGYRDYTKLPYKVQREEVVEIFKEAGFTNVKVRAVEDLNPGNDANVDCVAEVLVNRHRNYRKGDWYPEDADILVKYHVYKTKEQLEAEAASAQASAAAPAVAENIVLVNDSFAFVFRTLKIDREGRKLCLEGTFNDRDMRSGESDDFDVEELFSQDYFVVAQKGWAPYNDDLRFNAIHPGKVKVDGKEWNDSDGIDSLDIRVPLHEEKEIYMEFALDNLSDDVTFYLREYDDTVMKKTYAIRDDSLVYKH